MKKQYFVNYYRNFANTYTLYYATADTVHLVPSHYQRITRKEALRMAATADEWGSKWIEPIDGPDDIINDRRYQLIGRIWERIV